MQTPHPESVEDRHRRADLWKRSQEAEARLLRAVSGLASVGRSGIQNSLPPTQDGVLADLQEILRVGEIRGREYAAAVDELKGVNRDIRAFLSERAGLSG